MMAAITEHAVDAIISQNRDFSRFAGLATQRQPLVQHSILVTYGHSIYMSLPRSGRFNWRKNCQATQKGPLIRAAPSVHCSLISVL